MVAFCAALAAVRTLAGFFLLGAELDPDTRLYAMGGLGLWPSPLGRLAGAGGVELLAIVSAAASSATVLLVAAIAHELGRSTRAAAVLALVAPLPAFWLLFPGVDALGVALLLAGLLSSLRAQAELERAFLVAAALAHLSLVPIVGLLLVRRRARLPIVALALLAVAALALTEYGRILAGIELDRAHYFAGAALLTIAAGIGSGLFLLPDRAVRAYVLAAIAGVGIAAGAQRAAAAELTPASRYALPLSLVVVAAGAPRRRRWSSQSLPQAHSAFPWDAAPTLNSLRGGHSRPAAPLMRAASPRSRTIAPRSTVRANHDTRRMEKMKPALVTPAPNSSDAIAARRAYRLR